MKLKGIHKTLDRMLIIRGFHSLQELMKAASKVVNTTEFIWVYKNRFFNRWKRIERDGET